MRCKYLRGSITRWRPRDPDDEAPSGLSRNARRHPRTGRSSLLAGLDVAGENCETIALLRDDQPGVRTEFVDRVIVTWLATRQQTRPWAAVTSYPGNLGHPFVFAGEAFAALRSLHGAKAAWKSIGAHPERLSRVEIAAPLPPDVDDPEDYARAPAHGHSIA